ncbi:hypothetical protein BH23PAT2_BH23PAT2_06330 [soil metagenome]
MAKDAQRVFIIIIVAVFLLSTLAFTGIIIYSIVNDPSDTASQEISDEELQALMDDQQDQPTETPEGPMLKGTQLEGFEPISSDVNEIQITDIQQGQGEAVQPGATIVADYTGAYAVNGEIFESSKDSGQPLNISLDSLIPGWQQGIPGMKPGGIRRLVIPGKLAYGEAPEGYTPGSGGQPLGTLVFDIELFEVQ